MTGARDPKIKRLHPSLIPALVPPSWTYSFKVDRKGMFAIQPRLAEKAHFLGRIKRTEGWDHLQSKRTYRAYYNPYAPDIAVVCSEEGHYLGLAEQFVIPTATDTAAILRNLGKVGQYHAEEMQGPVRRSAGVAEARQEMVEHNAQVERGIVPGGSAEGEDEYGLTADDEADMLRAMSGRDMPDEEAFSIFDLDS